jgi:hypothetical protein
VLPHPKLQESSTDEVAVEEGALEVLAAHGQAEYAWAQLEVSTTRTRKKCDPSRRVKMRDQPIFRS